MDYVTGYSARNQLYFDFMTQEGVKNPKQPYTRAPEYLRSAAAAAFTYGNQDTPEDIIITEYLDSYDSGKGTYTDNDLQAIMDLLLRHP